MPRRRASRSLSEELENHQVQLDPSNNQPIESRFFGQASGMILGQEVMSQNDPGHDGTMDGTLDGNVDVDVDVDVELSGDGQQQVEAAVQDGEEPSGTPTRGRTSKRSKNKDHEIVPVNINELRLRQLKEDRDAYHYDLQWCQDVLDNDDLTPSEKRNFQMRQLDLGHQLRMTNHNIVEYEAEMQNHRFFGGGPVSNSFGRQSAYTTAYNPRTSFMNAEPPQERRGPGRPPGSKNRPKDSMSTPQPPSSNAQKAAALASAGALKRTLPNEIRVATPDGGTTEGHPHKRPRIEVGSPIGSTTEDDIDMNETANAAAVEINRRSSEDVDKKDDTIIKGTNTRDTATKQMENDQVQNGNGYDFANNNKAHNNKAHNKKNINASAGPSTSSQALPARNTHAGKNTGPPATVNTNANANMTANGNAEHDPTGPMGKLYQRLGHHMCQLCTSQKYLTQTTPKQPSEPSSWPLRDISKMVTHYTRMHGEHSRTERCMELGRALHDNRGPFRYWLRETKRAKVSAEEVDSAIAELAAGGLPELLRRNSNAARGFPRG